MKNFVHSLLFMSMLIALTGCSDDLTLGFTPTGIPITLSMNSQGFHVSCSGAIITPIGTVSLNYYIPENNYTQHFTYIELINRLDSEKHIIRLDNIDESVNWESSNCKITVVNRAYSTVVTVESDEISNFMHKRKGEDAGYKPDFPNSPLNYFCLFKLLKSHVNWEINSVADLVGDIIFGIIAIFAILLDLLIIVFLFILRFLWWVLLLLGYLIGVV